MTENPVSSDHPVTLDEQPPVGVDLRVDPGTPTNPVTPADSDTPVTTPAPRKKAPGWRTPLIIVAVILVVLLLAAGGGFAYLRSTETRLLADAQSALTAGNWSAVEPICKELNGLPASLLVDPNRCLPLRGEAYYQLGRLDEALADLQATQPQYPGQAQRYLRITQIYLQQNKPDLALASAVEAQKRDDTLALPYTLQAVDAYRRNQVKDAEQAAQAALKRDPKQAAALRVLGSIQAWRGETKAAFESLNQAITLDPKDFGALAERAMLNLHMDRYDAFRADSELVIAQSTTSPASLVLQALQADLDYDPLTAFDLINDAIRLDDSRPEYYYLRAGLYPTTQKESKSEIADLDKALQLYPDFFLAQGTRADYLFSLYESIDLKTEAERLMQAAPESGMGQQMMARYFSRQRNWTSALEWADKYIEILPDVTSPYFLRGGIQLSMDQNELAQADFEKGLKINPKSLTAHSGLVHVYLNQKKNDEALKLTGEMLEIAPELSYVYFEQATVLISQKKFEKARQALAVALEIDPLNIDALLNRAYLSIDAKDYPAATQDAASLAEINPKAPEAFVLRADIYRAQEDSQRALEELNRAIEINPYIPYPRQVAAYVSFDLKDYKQALTFSEAALRLDPKNWDLQQLVVQIYLRQKEYDQAIAAAQKTLKLKPDMGSMYLLQVDAQVAKDDYGAATQALKDSLPYLDQFNIDQVQRVEEDLAFYAVIPPLVDGKRTINDTKNGYTLSYSPTWDLGSKPGTGDGIVLLLKARASTEEKPVLITVIFESVPAIYANRVTVQMVGDILRQDLIPLGFKFTPRKEFKGAELGLTDDFEVKNSKTTSRGRMYYFYTPGRLIAIQLTVPEELFDQYQAEVEEIAKTFKFIK
jgi:tetratricopeptide (TPR) repeat protein